MEAKIDKILRKNGWVSQPNSQGKSFRYYSSLTADVVQKWKKEGKKTTVITGLNVVGYGVCLIHPLPKIVTEKMYKKPNLTPPDPLVIEWIEKATDKEINNFLNSVE